MIRSKSYTLWAILTLLSGMLMAQPRGPEPSLDSIMNHVRNLSSADYEGRLAGTEAYMDAVRYCQQALTRYGVQPYQGNWNQLFEVECNQIENATFKTYMNQNDDRKVHVLGKDFCCAATTGRGYADANVVFCGYGIDDASYNEYANVDAQGKIALVLSGVPKWLPSTVTSKYETLRDKARAARRHGVCALVVINMNENCVANEVQCYAYNGEPPHMPTFPVIIPTRQCGAELFDQERMTLDSVLNLLESSMKPQSFHLRKKFEIEINTIYHPSAVTCNVVGMYPGSNPSMKREFIVIGASLDHVGMQGRTCLFPGADGNASGVAALLETARLLQQAEEQPGRNVIFVLFGASEQHYLGSRIFVSNFMPHKRIEAFVDVQNIGMGESVAVLGNNKYPGLWNVANSMDSLFCHVMQHDIKTNPQGNAKAFDAIGIPCINITNVNGAFYNHRPSDIAENINREYLLDATRLVFQTIYELSFGDYQGRTPSSRNYRFK